MRRPTNVQLREKARRVSLLALMSAGPDDVPDVLLRRVTIDLSDEDFVYLEKLAAYRNALAEAEKRRITPWSRKGLCESYVAAGALNSRKKLSEQFAACGELPDAKDEKAVAAYVAKVIAWSGRDGDE